MTSRVQHTIQIKCDSSIKCTSLSQQRSPPNFFKKDSFNKVYDSDGEPGPLCDTEYLEDTQYFDYYALPYAPLPRCW